MSAVNTQHIKMSIRLSNGIVTSLTIKKNIVALWIIFAKTNSDIDLTTELNFDKLSSLVNTFVYKCMNDWKQNTGKGLSDFITEKMIRNILNDGNTYSIYCDLIKGIKI